jgi:hypothetical protein
MRGVVFLVFLSLLVGVSGCSEIGSVSSVEDTPESGGSSGDDEKPADEDDETSEENRTTSDASWKGVIRYDYVRNPGEENTVNVDIPEAVTALTVTIGFLYWPQEAGSGFCSTETGLTVEVNAPNGSTVMDQTFDDLLEAGHEGQRCTAPTSKTLQHSRGGDWRVSFRGDGVAVAEASFQAS